MTALAIALAHRRELRARAPDLDGGTRPVLGLGLAAAVAATVLVVALRAPAVPVLAVGLAAAVVRAW